MAEQTIVVVGSINMDLVTRVARFPQPGETLTGSGFAQVPGGKGANQAVSCARLGAAVALLGCVGRDTFADTLLAGLQAEGVDTEAVRRVDGPSGVAAIQVDAHGANTIVVVPGANSALRPESLDASYDLLAGASLVLAQLETPLDSVLHLAALCETAGVPLMLDPAPAPAQPLPAALLRRVTWLTPNETETQALLRTGERLEPAAAADRLLSGGARNVVLKLGERGAFLQGSDAAALHVPAFPVQAVDTTAAGDCFNGAFAVALSEGAGPEQAARFACAAAALSTTGHGAQPSLPSREAVDLFVSRGADPA